MARLSLAHAFEQLQLCPGYHGRPCVRYWEVDDSQPPTTPKLPYRIELVGVTCDPGLAVARGIWCASTRRPCSAERRGCSRARPPVWAGHSYFWGQESIAPLATVPLSR